MDLTDRVEIKRARPTDAEKIWQVTRKAFLPYKDIIKPDFGALNVSVSAIRRQIATKQRKYVGVWFQGRLVATLRYKKYAKYLALSRLAVLPEYQNHGLGRMLMQWIEKEALRLGVKETRGDVRTALPGLLEYYQKMGYQPYKMRSVPGYKNYLVAIKKRLNNSSGK
jgi:predicted N-acetyltransferase YhbS